MTDIPEVSPTTFTICEDETEVTDTFRLLSIVVLVIREILKQFPDDERERLTGALPKLVRGEE